MITNGSAQKHSHRSKNNVAFLRITCVTLTRVTLTMSKGENDELETCNQDFG